MSQSSASTPISKTPTSTRSSSYFKVVFETALKAYTKKTKQDLNTHPLATQLQECDSPAAILTILQDQVDQFTQSQSGDDRLRKWLNPTINVLYAFSSTLGEGVGLVFSPAKVIFAGAGVLLLAAKEVEASQDVLIDIFERIENFFRRLEVYIKVPPTSAMTDMMVKIMVEILDILGTATKEMKQSRAKKFLKKVAGIKKLDDGLKKLDKMTNEEARMASAEVMRVAYDIDENVKLVEEKVQMIIDDGKEATTKAKLITQQTAYGVDDVKRRQLRESLRKWQSPSDPSTNHNISSNRQHEGTSEWFCEGNIYEEWKANGSLLWIHGKPGSGKSVLCSAIINDISTLHKAKLATMAYFYFDFRDVNKQSLRDLLPSLLIQLSARSDPFCDILSRLYEEYDDGTRQPSDGALVRCLKDMLTLQGPVYLILDALDECPNISGVPSPREQVLDLVKELVGLRLPSLHICVTSRREVDIQDTLESLASHTVSLHEESGQKKDIVEYIRSVVDSNSVRAIRRWRDADKALVIETLSERADGMFRWVYCQLETLRHCLPQNIPRVLSELPASLDETYERVLREIGTANRHHAYRLLQCLTVAIRPLRVEELAEILALDFDDANDGLPDLKEDWRWKDQKEAVLSTCSTLITVVGDGSHRVVQFSHFSVKEYLTSDRLASSSAGVSDFHISPEPAHTVIVKACLGILLQSDNVAGNAEGKSSSLAKYAAEYWMGHARFKKVSTQIEDGMQRLFDPAEPYFEAWLKLYDIGAHKRWYTFVGYDEDERESPLYYASLCGLRDLAAHLVAKHPKHVNATFSRPFNPLVAALHNRHFDTAELLYQRGADVGIRGYVNRTLLDAASVDGFVDIGQWLLAHGADAILQQDDRETPLHLAAMHQRLEFVRMLLEQGIMVDAKNENYRTSLHLASEFGQVEIVRLLLQYGADTAARDSGHSTPLHLASSYVPGYRLLRSRRLRLLVARAETVQVLLKHGADVTAQDDTHSTPLHLASSLGSADIVQILLEHGANVNAMDRSQNTPLHLASSNYSSLRMFETMQLLIKHGADVNARDGTHKTPLHLASHQDERTPTLFNRAGPDEKSEFVRALIQHGADVNAQDETRLTPLHLASSTRCGKTVKLLIQHGADVNAHDGSHSTPLHLAASSRFALDENINVVKLLLSQGANVDEKDDKGQTPFQIASLRGLSKITELLSDHRVSKE